MTSSSPRQDLARPLNGLEITLCLLAGAGGFALAQLLDILGGGL